MDRHFEKAYISGMLAKLADVRRALDRDELVPAFQPLVELRTGKLAGFEVLARWQHPELGPVLPSNFIALCEENNLLGQLMKQTLRQAFQSAALLPKPLVLAINISPSQLHDITLPIQIRQAAAESGFSFDQLVVEITESALANSLDCARTIVGELKSLGCRLALDDFGTGYSSLRHLQALPFDELKVDISFVQSMTRTRESRKIVAAIVGLGHSLGLTTVAEGVETEEQTEMLLWLGCEMGQGWLYGHPQLADQIPAMLAAPPHIPRLAAPGDNWAVSSLEALPSQSLAQLQAIYDGVPAGLCFLDNKLRYVSINRRLAEINGPSVSSHIGHTVEEMIPESFPAIRPYLLRALKGEAVSEVEIRRPALVAGDPDRTILTSCHPAFDEADEVIGVSVAVVEVTQRTALETLPDPDLHKQMFESNPQIPWMMDAEGNNLEVSSRWVQTTGLIKGMRNLGWLEALHDDDLESTIRSMRHALDSGDPIDIEYRIRDIDGEWRWMRSRGSPRFGADGEILRWYGIVEDIDEHKMMADALPRIRE